jgi:hypothetical protein
VALIAMGWFLGTAPSPSQAGSPGPTSCWCRCSRPRASRSWFGAGGGRSRSTGRAALTLTGLLLAVFAVTDISRDRMRSASAPGQRARAPLGRQCRPGRAPGLRRDIYLIVLDEYANSRVLRERFGHDNHEFEDSLRALGFHIPRVVRSNYVHTMLSIPSLLNAAHLAPLAGEVGRRSTDPALANRLLDRSRVAVFLKQRGYRYVFFPSQWWYSTRRSPLADVEPQVWDGSLPLRELGRTELPRGTGRSLVPEVLRTLVGRRPRPPLARRRHAGAPVRRPGVRGGTSSARTALRGRRLPLTARGRPMWPARVRQPAAASPGDRADRAGGVPPIILLQGDHGTATLGYSDWPTAAQVPAAAARERFGAFGAYYLPGGGAAEFGDTVTVVNVMGNVLRYYFGAGLPREPDAQYLSLERAPYDFRRVDPAWLAPRQKLHHGFIGSSSTIP